MTPHGNSGLPLNLVVVLKREVHSYRHRNLANLFQFGFGNDTGLTEGGSSKEDKLPSANLLQTRSEKKQKDPRSGE